jgi:hypothetical protein
MFTPKYRNWKQSLRRAFGRQLARRLLQLSVLAGTSRENPVGQAWREFLGLAEFGLQFAEPCPWLAARGEEAESHLGRAQLTMPKWSTVPSPMTACCARRSRDRFRSGRRG